MAQCYYTHQTDPFINLAQEMSLVQAAQEPVLYLWQNAPSIILGRCQNVWAELDVTRCNEQGVQIVRRETGGGAVYHDLGNLNFSFIVPRALYDVDGQTQVILQALAAVGVQAQQSGRNDLLVDGRKISGSAYRLDSNCLHHGTLLYNVDLHKLGSCLTPSHLKLQAKGVKSVRTRVCNLIELVPTLTLGALGDALVRQFQRQYGAGLPQQLSPIPGTAQKAVELRSAAWRFNATPPFDVVCEHRFAFGQVSVHLRIVSGHVREAMVFTDALNTQWTQRLQQAWSGVPYGSTLSQRAQELDDPQAEELGKWMETII